MYIYRHENLPYHSLYTRNLNTLNLQNFTIFISKYFIKYPIEYNLRKLLPLFINTKIKANKKEYYKNRLDIANNLV